MSKRLDEDEIEAKLSAFADGQLGEHESSEVLEHLAADPDAIRRVLAQRRLRQAASRSVRAATPPVPAALRARLQALQPPVVPRPPVDPTGDRLRRIGRRALVVAALAACLVLGVLVGRMLGVRPASHDGVVPASFVLAVTRTHVDCSRYEDHSHPPEFPAEEAAVPEAIRRRLGRQAFLPDLSSTGYRFAGAGACTVPGASTVHIVFRATASGTVDSVSLFIQPDVGQAAVKPETVYRLSGAESAHPVLLWRRDGLIFYLVGDDEQVVEKVKDSLNRPRRHAA